MRTVSAVAQLHFETIGNGPRVVLLHGFTQTGRCWPVVADALAESMEVVLVDLPGHGRSVGVPTDPISAATFLAEAIGAADWIGYSLGARYLLNLALASSEVVQRMILISATAGIEDEASRNARHVEDEQRVAHLRSVGLEHFVREWLKMEMFSDVPDDMNCLAERLTNTVEGLASSLVDAGQGTFEPIWDRLSHVTCPALVVAGRDDPAYCGAAARIVEAMGPRATLELVPGAGHAVHLSQPTVVIDLIRSFLGAR